MLSRNHRILAGVTVLAVAVGAGWKSMTGPPPPPPAVKDVAPRELLAAIAEIEKPMEPSQKPIPVTPPRIPRAEVTLERNGMNILQVWVANGTTQPVSIHYKASEVFEDGITRVVLLKSFALKVPPGATETHDLPVVAISSSKQGDRGKFTSSSETQSNLEPLIHHLESHPTLPMSVVQTAALAIAEDAPVDVFARFPRLRAPATGASDAFRVNTIEIIAALQLLREIGVDSCKLSSDPQLKIEAMVDPAAHASAMQYFGIDSESEWQYWRHELLDGEPSTRHYALYGIGRFYPEVALEMMPRWALEQRIAPHFRLAAIGALASTRKFEAAPILQALERDLALEDQIAQHISPALRRLEQNLSNAL